MKSKHKKNTRSTRRATALPSRRRYSALTLIEVLLVLLLMVVLAGMGILSFRGLKSSQNLDEAALQVEGMVRMARADAANTGKRIRLTLAPGRRDLHVLWEPEPLRAPGKFVEYTSAVWAQPIDLAATTVVRCEVSDANATAAAAANSGTAAPSGNASSGSGSNAVGSTGSTTAPSADNSSASSDGSGSTGDTPGSESSAGAFPDTSTDTSDASTALPPGITFGPDGSCESSTIELACVDGSDSRHALVQINGLSGQVDTRFLTLSDMQSSGSAGGSAGLGYPGAAGGSQGASGCSGGG
jgi:type II secretory pathway pseudopilin PulG